MSKKVVVTGGGGFIGAHLVKKLVSENWNVSVIDNMLRGDQSRLSPVIRDIDLYSLDIRDENKVAQSINGADVVMHLAAINGTENFYKHPELVLDVGMQGMLAVVNACRKANIPDLVVASSAEVYQTPSIVPTPETIPLTLPNSTNPRYSYGGSKIISELIALNYAQEHFQKVQIFRPHNIYGPDMGQKHVIPQFILRAKEVLIDTKSTTANFPIQGSGDETRAFCYVDDVVNGILTMYEKGKHREIYHIGNDDEVSIKDVVSRLGTILGGKLNVITSAEAEGGTPRRCPDISKMQQLGYTPQIDLNQGLKITLDWYLESYKQDTANQLL